MFEKEKIIIKEIIDIEIIERIIVWIIIKRKAQFFKASSLNQCKRGRDPQCTRIYVHLKYNYQSENCN